MGEPLRNHRFSTDVQTEMLRRPHILVMLILALVVGWPPPSSAVEPNQFVDDDRNRFEPYIERAAVEGIVSGCNPPHYDRFCPDRVVTRGEMAVMLARAIEVSPAEGSPFVDTDGHYAERAAQALAATGVTRGCEENKFCPDRPLTRGEMASLVANALGWEPTRDTNPYFDLDQSPHGPALAELARRGGLEPCDSPVGLRLCPQRTVTRAEAAYTLVAALGLGVTEGSRIEPTPRLIGFVDNFETLDLWDGRSPSTRNRVTLTDGGYRGTGLRVTIPQGSHFGADFRLPLHKQVGEEPELLYFRYMLRFDPDWATSSGGKLPGFSGVYGRSGKGGFRSSPSQPGWSSRVQFFRTGKDDPRIRLGYYVYHLGQETKFGDGMAWNQAGMLVPGEWYCVEGQVLLNTPGEKDGALRAWIDGTPVFDASGLQFRRPEEPNIRIESFWFNVYHGGKAVADRNLGLTVDRVMVDGQRIGCDAGDGTALGVSGDFRGDGFDDHLWWGPCPGGSCFQLLTRSTSGKQGVMELGDGAWFSLETHRLGMASGDLNGDGRDELVYRGRCEGSARCWRVHSLNGDTWNIGENWGDGARFASYADSIAVGDWNGNGRADLAYLGLCGSEPHSCWRVHRSQGHGFADPEDWGRSPESAPAAVMAADVTGNGREDLVYMAACGDETCWFVQTSLGDRFSEPLPLGKASESEADWTKLFDWDGDGRADLVSIRFTRDTHQIQVRLMKPDRLTDAVTVAEFNRPVTDLALRHRRERGPVDALVTLACADGSACVEPFMGYSMKLLTPAQYQEAVAERTMCLGRPESPSGPCPSLS